RARLRMARTDAARENAAGGPALGARRVEQPERVEPAHELRAGPHRRVRGAERSAGGAVPARPRLQPGDRARAAPPQAPPAARSRAGGPAGAGTRSEEHTSELQSRF